MEKNVTLKYEFETAHGYKEWEKEVTITLEDYMGCANKTEEEAISDFENDELDEDYVHDLENEYEYDAKRECTWEYGQSKGDREAELADEARDREWDEAHGC